MTVKTPSTAHLPPAAPIVETASGKVRGATAAGVYTFKGIPYAADTSGPNRFMAPRDVAAWSGVRDALRLGDRSPQGPDGWPKLPALSWLGGDSSPMSENCCALNVYTPNLDAGANRPVMVYLHGGSYTTGSGGEQILDGCKLAKFGDVVVVTVNHRLNVFGYTYLGDLDEDFADAGNAGQLDLVAALRWVNRNIAAFGGDAANVTIFGQSGGGGKVMALMGMPAAQGLFHKAINMSGPWHDVPAAKAARYASELFKQLGGAARDAASLQQAPTQALLHARGAAVRTCGFDGARPIIDGRHIPAGVMSPAGLALHASVPLLMGTTSSEATVYFSRDLRNFKLTHDQLKARIRGQYGVDDADAQALIAAYQQDEPQASAAQVLASFASDMRFRLPMLRAVLPKADAGTAPVYLYNFGWTMPVDGGIWGTPHMADIPFAFANVDRAASMTGGGPDALEVSRNLASAFVAFARTGHPGNERAPSWRPYSSAARATMRIDVDCRQVDDFQGMARIAGASYEGLDGPTLDRGPLFNYMD
ncbi:MAG TPA: carboxylesterase family protein [Ramlibacter sp.]|nr:carboxylesterase family protein [Ramlibacter sp.]